jgi:hypothetical protein
VVDDIAAVTVIAIAYTSQLALGWLAVAAVGVLAGALLLRWVVLPVLGWGCWGCSGSGCGGQPTGVRPGQCRCRLGRRGALGRLGQPGGLGGLGALAGIGFTVALFVTGLAYSSVPGIGVDPARSPS